MTCRANDLRYRDVINLKDGCRLGCVNDLEIDTSNACVKSIIVYGRARCWGLFGREEDLIIPWDNIEVIGEDTVLVCHIENILRKKRKTRLFESFFAQ